MPRRSKPIAIADLLDVFTTAYGPRPWYSRNEPLTELVTTILAQHTSDLNAERSFALLWQRYSDWQAIADAPTEQVVNTIRTGGLAQQKGPRIQGVLREIHRRRGDYDLHFLKDLPFDVALEWLTTLNGIGPKTARCVLVFSLGMPAIPVDTHVHRVLKRLALIPPKLAADPAHRVIEAMVPEADKYRFHVYLIEHGRGVCRAINPRCDECPLQQRCPASVTALRARAKAAAVTAKRRAKAAVAKKKVAARKPRAAKVASGE